MSRVNAAPFNLMAQLKLRAAQRSEFRCEKDFSFYSIPVHILENVQHLAERFKSAEGLKTTENDVVDLLVRHGLQRWEKDPDIQLWLTLRESIIGIEPSAWRDSEDYELVRVIMDDIKVGVNPCGREPTKKRNVRLMDATVAGTTKLASSIGLNKSVSQVGILLLMRGQTALSKDEVFNYDEMRADLVKLIAKLRKRTRYLSYILTVADVELGEDFQEILDQCEVRRQGVSLVSRVDTLLLPVAGKSASSPVVGKIQSFTRRGSGG